MKHNDEPLSIEDFHRQVSELAQRVRDPYEASVARNVTNTITPITGIERVR